ncbi:uncharacterized protein [Argopecten irradians]|uniref:uncharacterized protein n=1 Tax=Argopecten irradians TaxID=31199 RepID=UPI0037184A92
MPGVKRKASSVPGEKLPAKLKKQSTSVTVDRAIPTQAKKLTKKTTLSSLSKVAEENPNKKIAAEKKEAKPMPALPRFPTLVPTNPAGTSGSDFVFNVSPTSSSKQGSSSSSKSAEVPGLRKEPTALIKTGDISGNKASDIEKSVLRLSSGSYVGRIMNNDDQMLPTLESLAVYEQKQKSEKTSDAPFTWDMTDTDNSPVRKSVYDVSAVLNLLDQENSPTKCSIGGSTSDNDSEAPPVLQAEVYDSAASEDFDDDAAVPTLTCIGTPSKSPGKSPRKMTGGPREIVFSFDTTGSMYNYMEEASYKMRELMNRVQEDMPGIRLAFVAHGDYYDLANDRYLIKWIDFGASVDEVDTFFENLPITHGGDADECYELVLRKVWESLSWTPGSQRSLVMIGDSDPHEPGYTFNDFINDIDWREETKHLNEMGVRIYALQVGYTSNFYKQISQMTGGAHLRIENTEFTYDTLISICLREGGLRHLKGYEHEVRSAAKKSGNNGGTLDLELERLFSSLKNIADNKSLKQRERENKLKARILEMSTDPKTVAVIKRPSEDKASALDVKKPKAMSKSTTKTSEKSKALESSSPQKLTKIKDKGNDKSKTKVSIEKVKKGAKAAAASPRGRPRKEEKKVAKSVKNATTPKDQKAARPRGRPRKDETEKNVAKSVKKDTISRDQKAARPRGRPRKAESEKNLCKLVKKDTSKSQGSSPKPTPTSKKVGRPVMSKGKANNNPDGTPRKRGRPSKSVETSKTEKPTKAKKEEKATTTKKKEETTIKSPSSVVQRIVAAKLKRLKKNSNSKVKLEKKLKTAVKAKDTKTKIKSKVEMKNVSSKSKTVAKKTPKSTKDSGKSVLAKLSLKKKEGKAKIAKLKSKLQDKKKAAQKASSKKAEKATKAKKPTTKEKKSNQPKGKMGKPSSVQQREKKVLKKTAKKETKPAKTSPTKAKTAKKPTTVVKKPAKSSPAPKSLAKSAQKSKSSNTEQRENISGSKFSTGPLSNVKWSPWVGIISPKSNGSDWSKARNWCGGHSNEALYRGEQTTQALYEAAVVPPGSNNKYVVTYVAGQGAPAVRVWDCFNAPQVRQQVQRVVKDKGAIYVRRGVIAGRAKDSLIKAEEYIKENFDYAWRGSRRTTEVRKEGFVVAKP